jgi:hypothetical protein
LNKWGYSYNYSRKGWEITQVPQTAKERLTEILLREYGLDV